MFGEYDDDCNDNDNGDWRKMINRNLLKPWIEKGGEGISRGEILVGS